MNVQLTVLNHTFQQYSQLSSDIRGMLYYMRKNQSPVLDASSSTSHMFVVCEIIASASHDGLVFAMPRTLLIPV